MLLRGSKYGNLSHSYLKIHNYSNVRDFLSLIYIYIYIVLATGGKKHKLKMGVAVLVSSQNDKKLTISVSNDHFALELAWRLG